MSNEKITDHRPHLVPAIYNWMAENFSRIYISFIRKHPGVDCPPCNYSTDQFSMRDQEDGPVTVFNIEMVTLNFGAEAVGNFAFNSEGIVACVRFGGKLANVKIPFTAIKRIYSPDSIDSGYFLNHHFSEDDIQFSNEMLNKASSNTQQTTDSTTVMNKGRPTLVRVK